MAGAGITSFLLLSTWSGVLSQAGSALVSIVVSIHPGKIRHAQRVIRADRARCHSEMDKMSDFRCTAESPGTRSGGRRSARSSR